MSTHAPTAERVFIAYGAFTDPLTGLNFVVCRIPADVRCLWHPAMRRLRAKLKSILGVPQHKAAPYFNVDGLGECDMARIWANHERRRLQWDGADWQEVTSQA